jgi:pimeloyl-ACP methyl ester carboxylesterase
MARAILPERGREDPHELGDDGAMWTGRGGPRDDGLGRAIEGALRARVGRASPLVRGLRADIVFDASGVGRWSLRFRNGRATMRAGRVFRPTSTLFADATTMLDVIEGRVRGADAFLEGRLSVRGNLALPLELDDLLHPLTRDVRAPRVRRTEAAGVRTFYLEAGHADAPPVVLLHGLGGTSASFLPTICDLSVDHRVIAVDLPGFGESDKPLRALRPAFFARHVTKLLDALRIRRAHVVGNSMGGRVALEVALSAPERVDKVVLLCPSMAWRRFRFAAGLVRLLRHELAIIPMPILHFAVVRGLRSLFAAPDRVPAAGIVAAADEFMRVFSTARGRVAFFNAMREIYLEDPHGETGFWDRLPRLSRPSLFVFGERDWLVPRAYARHVARAVPAARCEILPACGHVPQYEHPERTHALMREFFALPEAVAS